MTDTADGIALPEPPLPVPARSATTKTETVTRLLSRNRGATLAEIVAATHWQPHSTRAFLTGVRKKVKLLLKETRRDGATCYRIEH